MNYIVLFMTYELSVILIVSGFMKALSIERFGTTFRQLGFRSFIPAMAWTVVVLELLASILLIIEPIREIGQLLTITLLISFGWSVWRASRIKQKVQCSCFGSMTQEALGRNSIIRVLVMAIMLATSIGGAAILRSSELDEKLVAMMIAISTFTVGMLVQVIHSNMAVVSRKQEENH